MLCDALEHLLDVLASSRGSLEEPVELPRFLAFLALLLRHIAAVLEVYAVSHKISKHILLRIVFDLLRPRYYIVEALLPEYILFHLNDILPSHIVDNDCSVRVFVEQFGD